MGDGNFLTSFFICSAERSNAILGPGKADTWNLAEDACAAVEALEAAGIVVRELFLQVPPRVEYRLTEWGQALCPVLDAMLKWVTAGEVCPAFRTSKPGMPRKRKKVWHACNLIAGARAVHRVGMELRELAQVVSHGV